MLTSDKPKTQFSYFSEKQGVVVKWGPPSTSVAKEEGNGKHFKYSDNGRYVAIVLPSQVTVLDVDTMESLVVLNEVNVTHVYFSPLGNYLVTYQRPNKECSVENLKIWSVDGGKLLIGWKVRHQISWPSIRWTTDELVAGAILQFGQVRFFQGSNFINPVQQISTPGITSFSISPGKTPKVSVFVPEKGNTPGTVSIYSYPRVDKPLVTKNFFADSVDISWNSNGSAILLTVSQEIDKSGKSYYGKKGLYLIEASGAFDARVTGESIHDVQWNPNGTEFAVIYGDMPDPKVSLFDLKCQKTADLAESGEARNALFYDPKGRLLCIGGFGSLKGNLDFYDLTAAKIRKVGSANAFSSGYHAWCPDSQHFLTAVIAPRMRIDNGIKIFDYNGNVVFEEPLLELFDVKWRPIPPESFPTLPINAPVQSTKGKAVSPVAEAPKVYRHPHFTAKTDTQVKASTPTRYVPPSGRSNPTGVPVGGLPVGGVPVGGGGENSGKGRGKNPKKKPQSPGGNTPGSTPISTPSPNGGRGNTPSKQNEKSPQPQAPSPTIPDDQEQQTQLSPEQEKEKRKRNIMKKLREIEVLKQRQTNGDTLNPAQLTKISTEAALKNELQQLN